MAMETGPQNNTGHSNEFSTWKPKDGEGNAELLEKLDRVKSFKELYELLRAARTITLDGENRQVASGYLISMISLIEKGKRGIDDLPKHEELKRVVKNLLAARADAAEREQIEAQRLAEAIIEMRDPFEFQETLRQLPEFEENGRVYTGSNMKEIFESAFAEGEDEQRDLVAMEQLPERSGIRAKARELISKKYAVRQSQEQGSVAVSGDGVRNAVPEESGTQRSVEQDYTLSVRMAQTPEKFSEVLGGIEVIHESGHDFEGAHMQENWQFLLAESDRETALHNVTLLPATFDIQKKAKELLVKKFAETKEVKLETRSLEEATSLTELYQIIRSVGFIVLDSGKHENDIEKVIAATEAFKENDALFDQLPECARYRAVVGLLLDTKKQQTERKDAYVERVGSPKSVADLRELFVAQGIEEGEGERIIALYRDIVHGKRPRTDLSTITRTHDLRNKVADLIEYYNTEYMPAWGNITNFEGLSTHLNYLKAIEGLDEERIGMIRRQALRYITNPENLDEVEDVPGLRATLKRLIPKGASETKESEIGEEPVMSEPEELVERMDAVLPVPERIPELGAEGAWPDEKAAAINSAENVSSFRKALEAAHDADVVEQIIGICTAVAGEKLPESAFKFITNDHGERDKARQLVADGKFGISDAAHAAKEFGLKSYEADSASSEKEWLTPESVAGAKIVETQDPAERAEVFAAYGYDPDGKRVVEKTEKEVVIAEEEVRVPAEGVSSDIEQPDLETIDPAQVEAEHEAKAKAEREEQYFAEFSERFALTKEDIESIEGFAELTEGQRALALENFAQVTLGQVTRSAKEDYAREREHEYANAKIKGSEFLGKVWVNMRESFLKEKHVIEREKEKEADVRKGGLAVHGDELKEVIRIVKAGPEAHYNREGDLVVEHLKKWEGISKEGEQLLEIFNEQANARSTQRYEDVIVRSRKVLEQQKQYTEGYERTKAYLMEAMRKDGLSELTVTEAIAAVDAQVATAQLMRTHENALEALGEIKDASIWKRVAKSVGTEHGLYTGAGYILRGASLGMFGILAAAGIGGVRAVYRSEAELRERDRAQRAGAVDRRTTAKNMDTAAGERGAIAKIMYTLVHVEGLVENLEEEIRGDRGPIDATRISALQEEKVKLLRSVQRRLDYAEDKFNLGLIDFGNVNELHTKYEFMLALSEAKVRLAALGGVQKEDEAIVAEQPENTLRKYLATILGGKSERVGEGKKESPYARITRVLGRKEKKISNARLKFRVKEVAEGAVMAGTFAALGELLNAVFAGGNAPEGVIPTEAEVSVPESVATAPAEMPIEAGAAVGDGLSSHVVERGETLIGTLKANIPEIAGIADIRGAQAQDTAIANFINSLSKSDLQSAGITSGRPELIFANGKGDTIDMQKLRELFIQRQKWG